MIRYLKYYIITGLLFSLNTLDAQVLSFNHGTIEFYTATTLSDIEAISEKAIVSVDTQTGDVEVIIDIRNFEFEYDLMQEHFNEKYMESDKYPQAKFKGRVVQDISNFNDKKEVDVSGELLIHGVSKNVKLKVKLSKQNEFTVVKSKIPVVFKDYNVDEPSILTKSVAKDVEIECIFFLK